MSEHPLDDHDRLAARTTRLISHLDGALSPETLGAMQGIWSMLEHASASDVSHARAVRERLFWETLAPGGAAAVPGITPLAEPVDGAVSGLVAMWDEDPSSELDDADAHADAA